MANQFMPEKEVLKLKQEYPPGTRIVLNHMDDKWAVPPGTRGTVEYIDDGGHIHMRWDNGRSLSLVPEADDYRKMTKQELREEQLLKAQGQAEEMSMDTM